MDVLKTYVSPRRMGGPAEPKGKAAALQQQSSGRYGLARLLGIFAAWKTLLLAIACTSPGPGYDTSSQILLDQHGISGTQSWFGTAIEHIILRMTRWDAIYFASGSLHGQVYEQEWAFSWAMSKTTSFFARALTSLPLYDIVKHAISAIVISHVSHLLAVLSLYALTKELIPAPVARKRAVAFTASTLHVLSPAGLFLSAPYAESSFAFVSMTGTLCYVLAAKASRSHAVQRQASRLQWTVRAGFMFGLAAMLRSNGLLSGIPFAVDVLAAPKARQNQEARRKAWNQFLATMAAGSLVGVGFVLPQFVAYTEFCVNGSTRPWCRKLLPSIYSWVQEHYWEVGLFKYWILNNLPLFLLAAPMLLALLWTGYLALLRSDGLVALAQSKTEKNVVTAEETEAFRNVLPRLALPQLVLAVLAATSFHVQIINRISSGYPVWYIVLAIAIHASPAERRRVLGSFGRGRALEWTIRAMIMYAIVQGGLFASFLPPA